MSNVTFTPEVEDPNAAWALYYAGDLLAEGIDDATRQAIESRVLEVANAGIGGWLTFALRGSTERHAIFLSAGVPVRFTSTRTP